MSTSLQLVTSKTMPPTKKDIKKQYCCQAEVKVVASKYLSHKKCTSNKSGYKYASKVLGKNLNDYFIQYVDTTTDNKFNPRKKYFICENLKRIMNKKKQSSPLSVDLNQSKSVSTKQLPSSDTHNQLQSECDAPLSRDERVFMRSRIPVKSMKGINCIKLSIKGDEDVVINLKDLPSSKRAPYNEMFNKDVLASHNYYRLPFRNITMKQRNIRIKDLSKKILSACVDRKEYKKRGDDYLRNNDVLAVDLINLLDGIKHSLQSKLKLDFSKFEEDAAEPVLNDNEGVITELDDKKSNYMLAKSILGETSGKGYERLRQSFEDFISLPSYYKLIQSRPKMIEVELDIPNDNVITIQTQDTIEEYEVEQDTTNSQSLIVISEEQELENALRASSQSTSIKGAKIDGGYNKYLDLLETKHDKEGRLFDIAEKVLVIDSIDGAEHLRSKKNITSVISFSSTMITPSWIHSKEVTPGSSLNIITWMQLQGS